MTQSVKAAFQAKVVVLPLSRITPLKQVKNFVRNTVKYKQIAASLGQVGLIEPLVVFPIGRNKYWLLDGTLRFDILQSTGSKEARCLLATDDEAYNYNKRVNYLSAVAEHRMILKAIANGVTEQRIAAALDLDVKSIAKKRDLLDGICPEAVELLKDKPLTWRAFKVLRKMKPMRQVAASELMISGNNYSSRFAAALLAVTKPEFLVESENPRKPRVYSASQSEIMEQESDSLLRDFKAAEDAYARDILSLGTSSGYIRRLLANGRIHKYLSKNHPEILQGFEQVISEIDADKARHVPQKRPQSAAQPDRSLKSA